MDMRTGNKDLCKDARAVIGHANFVTFNVIGALTLLSSTVEYVLYAHDAYKPIPLFLVLLISYIGIGSIRPPVWACSLHVLFGYSLMFVCVVHYDDYFYYMGTLYNVYKTAVIGSCMPLYGLGGGRILHV